MPLIINNSVEDRQQRDAQVARRNKRIEELSAAHAAQMQADAVHTAGLNDLEMAKQKLVGEQGMAEQGLRNTGAMELAKTNNTAQEKLTGVNNDAQMKRQVYGDASNYRQAMDVEEQRQVGEGTRQKMVIDANQATLQQKSALDRRAANEALAGNLVLQGGVAGDKAQQVVNSGDSAPNLAGIETSKMQLNRFKPVKDGEVDINGNPIPGMGGGGNSILDTATGQVSRPIDQNVLAAHSAKISALKTPKDQENYMRALKLVDPEAFNEIMRQAGLARQQANQ